MNGGRRDAYTQLLAIPRRRQHDREPTARRCSPQHHPGEEREDDCCGVERVREAEEHAGRHGMPTAPQRLWRSIPREPQRDAVLTQAFRRLYRAIEGGETLERR